MGSSGDHGATKTKRFDPLWFVERNIDVNMFVASSCSQLRKYGFAAVSCAIAAAAAQPAMAEQSGSGPYAVVRAGVQLDADLKSRTAKSAPKAVSTAANILPQNVDAKSGFTGELGMGYDFGGVRVEGTIGHSSAAINGKRMSDATYIGNGRLKSLDIGVAAYVDLNPQGRLNPFLGAGIGVSRVSLNTSRLQRPGTPAVPNAELAGTRVNDRDWGFRWHLDAGVGYALTPATTLEIAGRYTRTTSLSFSSATRATASAVPVVETYKPRASSTSLMIGLRQKF